FIRSDCDSPLMSVMGNIMTDFNFHSAGVKVDESNSATRLSIQSKDAAAGAALDFSQPHLQPHSAFQSLEEAAIWLKYKPYGISVGKDGKANIVKIIRDENAWKSKLVNVVSADWDFIKDKDVKLQL